MAQPYVGEIRMFAGNFAPAGWMLCQGQLLPISENDALFTLIGTTYGGDGQTTFALPDLRGRIPLHMGQGPGTSSFVIGQQGGVETVTLTVNQLPQHTHPLQASTNLANTGTPTDKVLGVTAAFDAYIDDTPLVNMNAASFGSTGGSQPHDNMQPFLCINYIISLFGIFPSPT